MDSSNSIQRLSFDQILGLRGWGLILYGSLPANLALLGALEVKLGDVAAVQKYLIPVSFLPVFVTYLLIKNRQAAWFLTRDFLIARSLITTGLILILSTIISGASGVLRGRYTFSGSGSRWLGTSEAYLFGVASLVITSTLFMTVLSKDSDLPGLPSSKFVELLREIRADLRKVKLSPIWEWDGRKDWDNDNRTNSVIDDLMNVLANLKTSFTDFEAHFGKDTAIRTVGPLFERLDKFSNVVASVKVGGGDLTERTWKVYFAAESKLNSSQIVDRRSDQEGFEVVELVRSLQLGE
jgi:hypothetical protein